VLVPLHGPNLGAHFERLVLIWTLSSFVKSINVELFLTNEIVFSQVIELLHVLIWTLSSFVAATVAFIGRTVRTTVTCCMS